MSDPWTVLGLCVIVAGIFGVFLPFLPGAPLLFLGALLVDVGRGWTLFGPFWLLVLGLLAIVSAGAEWWISNMAARQGGASWRALIGGVVGGLLGLILLPPFGLVLGSIAGVVGVELYLSQDRTKAMRAGGGWLLGWLVSMVVEVGLAAVMLAIIYWRWV